MGLLQEKIEKLKQELKTLIASDEDPNVLEKKITEKVLRIQKFEELSQKFTLEIYDFLDLSFKNFTFLFDSFTWHFENDWHIETMDFKEFIVKRNTSSIEKSYFAHFDSFQQALNHIALKEQFRLNLDTVKVASN